MLFVAYLCLKGGGKFLKKGAKFLGNLAGVGKLHGGGQIPRTPKLNSKLQS